MLKSLILFRLGIIDKICAQTNSTSCIRYWFQPEFFCLYLVLVLLPVLSRSLAATGSRYSPATAGQPKGCPFRTIACAFNQRRLYANLQAADGLAAAGYVFEDGARWRELAVHPQDIPGFHGTRFDLQVAHLTCCSSLLKLAVVQASLVRHKTSFELVTCWRAKSHCAKLYSWSPCPHSIQWPSCTSLMVQGLSGKLTFALWIPSSP